MKFSDINIIRLNNRRTVGSNYEKSVPTSWPQRQDSDIDDADEEEKTPEAADIGKAINKYIDVMGMVNSWTPFRRVPDIRNGHDSSNLSQDEE